MNQRQFDAIVENAAIVERYTNPMLRPLCRTDFAIYDNARRNLHVLRLQLVEVPMEARCDTELAQTGGYGRPNWTGNPHAAE